MKRTRSTPLARFAWWQRLKTYQQVVWPLFFFTLAFTVRLWHNTLIPPSPYWEEVALGYDAYSVLQTGHDRLGNAWPVVAFPSFGDFKPSLYYYLLLPSIQLFGLSVWAVRLPAALASAGTVAVVYLLARRWLKPPVAGWAALLLTFQPWAWQVGRVGFEVNTAVFLIFVGIYALTLALEHWHKKPSRLFWLFSLLSATFLALSMYAYHGARVLAPLMAMLLVMIHTWQHNHWRQWTWWRAWLPSALVAAVLITPILLVIREPVVQQRFAETSIFTLPEPVLLSNQYRELAGNSLLARLVFHRYWFWGVLLLQNYWSHFSPTFLFGLAETNARHLSQLFGALYPWEFFTLLLGAAASRRLSKNRTAWLSLIGLTLAAPVAAMLTQATPHALRALPLASLLAIWSAQGSAQGVTLARETLTTWLPFPKRWQLVIPGAFIALIIGSAVILWSHWRWQYRVAYSQEWQYGYQELYQEMEHLSLEGETLYVSRHYGRPAMYLFFFEQIDPRRVQDAAQDPSTPKDQLELLAFENWRFTVAPNEPGLHAVSPAELPPNSQTLTTITDLAGETVWVIYRTK